MKNVFNFLTHKYWAKVWSLLFLAVSVWCYYIYFGISKEIDTNGIDFFTRGTLLFITSLILEIQYKLGI